MTKLRTLGQLRNMSVASPGLVPVTSKLEGSLLTLEIVFLYLFLLN